MGEDWKANVVIDPLERSERLYLWQPMPDGGLVTLKAVGTSDTLGGAVLERVDAGVRVPGIAFPRGALQAIADHLNPPDVASADVIAELREALRIERARVDEVLNRWVPRV